MPKKKTLNKTPQPKRAPTFQLDAGDCLFEADQWEMQAKDYEMHGSKEAAEDCRRRAQAWRARAKKVEEGDTWENAVKDVIKAMNPF